MRAKSGGRNLASVKPVKVYGMLCGKHLDTNGMDFATPTYSIDCTLLTTARYKKLMDVVKAAQKWKVSRSVMDAGFLVAAIEAAEKAGAL